MAAPGTVTFKFKLGPTANIAVSTSSAITHIASKTNVGWFLDVLFTVRSVGSGTAATIFGQGSFESESVIGSAVPTLGGPQSSLWQQATPVVGTGFDTSVANQLDLTAIWTTSTTNTLVTHSFSFMDLTTTP